MAEIPVKKKSGGLNWLWLLLVLVVLALLAWYFMSDERKVTDTPKVSQNVTMMDLKVVELKSNTSFRVASKSPALT